MAGASFPGPGISPGLAPFSPRPSAVGRGGGPQVITLHGLVLGPQICYEGLFPGFARSQADRGAHVFVNVTNDSWFGTWSEP